MGTELAALLIPPQEQRLRSRFDLGGAPLRLITSGWQKLIVLAPDRVFAFPRGPGQVAMVEREADVLSTVRPDIGPTLLGLHRDPGISPYPFLEVTRIPGTPWRHVEPHLEIEEAAQCLERLAADIARIHALAVPDRLAARPEYLDQPRMTTDLPGPQPSVWAEVLQQIAAMHRTVVHGEISRGQFLVDDQRQITGIVDWDGLHIGHPLLDLDFGVGLYRIYAPLADHNRLRQRIWTAYACSRADALPDGPAYGCSGRFSTSRLSCANTIPGCRRRWTTSTPPPGTSADPNGSAGKAQGDEKSSHQAQRVDSWHNRPRERARLPIVCRSVRPNSPVQIIRPKYRPGPHTLLRTPARLCHARTTYVEGRGYARCRSMY